MVNQDSTDTQIEVPRLDRLFGHGLVYGFADSKETCLTVGGISRVHLYELVKRGDFPKPYPLAVDRNGKASRVGWSRRELREWCESRMASRKGQPETTHMAAAA